MKSIIVKELRLKAIRERTDPSYTLFLSNKDSIELAPEFYKVAKFDAPGRFCDITSTREFIAKLASGELGDLTFRGMSIEWFCGDKPTTIAKKEKVPA